jgi:hypothetical protein
MEGLEGRTTPAVAVDHGAGVKLKAGLLASGISCSTSALAVVTAIMATSLFHKYYPQPLEAHVIRVISIIKPVVSLVLM